MRAHSKALGMQNPSRIIVTGGGSQNLAMVQVLADVMGAPVYAVSTHDSAALGAAYRAIHARVCSHLERFVSLEEALQLVGSSPTASKPKETVVAVPRPDAHRIYQAMEKAFLDREAAVAAEPRAG